MRIAVVLCATVLLAGCMHRTPKPAGPAAAAPQTQSPRPVIQPDLRVAGQVAMVNADARFAVISFPGGPVPEKGRMLNVYRGGTKVGQLRVTGPQVENNTVADILSGDVQARDQVTEQ